MLHILNAQTIKKTLFFQTFEMMFSSPLKNKVLTSIIIRIKRLYKGDSLKRTQWLRKYIYLIIRQPFALLPRVWYVLCEEISLKKAAEFFVWKIIAS